MTENPELLEGLFRDNQDGSSEAHSDRSSIQDDKDDDIVEFAYALMSGSTRHPTNEWIPAPGGNYFFHDTGKSKLLLLRDNCYFEYEGDGEFQFIGRVADRSMSEPDRESFPQNCQHIWLTSVPGTVLSMETTGAEEGEDRDDVPQKRLRIAGPKDEPRNSISDLILRAENRVPGFSDFVSKWNFPEQTIRHFLKFDRLLIAYIMRRFNPTKAKAKNAIIGFCDSLIGKYPQIWRWKSVIELEWMEEEANVEIRKLTDGQEDRVSFCSPDVQMEDAIILDKNFEKISGEIIFLGQDAYVMMTVDDPSVTVLVDGIRALSVEGPVGPLRDGSVIAFSKKENKSGIPNHLILVEIATEEIVLVNRRLIPSHIDPP